MKITKYYLDKELKFILYNVHEIKLKYSIFRQLYLDEKFTNINLRLRSIAVIFSELLLKNILMELSKLVVDSDKEDIEHYYEVAPIIVETINKEEKSDVIYNYIYDNIVDYCVEQIEQGNYDKAYNRYKNSVLTLEEQFAKPYLQQKFIKVLKRTTI